MFLGHELFCIKDQTLEDDQKALENYVKSGINEVEGWFYGGDVLLFQMLASLQQKLEVEGLCQTRAIGIKNGNCTVHRTN